MTENERTMLCVIFALWSVIMIGLGFFIGVAVCEHDEKKDKT